MKALEDVLGGSEHGCDVVACLGVRQEEVIIDVSERGGQSRRPQRPQGEGQDALPAPLGRGEPERCGELDEPLGAESYRHDFVDKQ